MANVLDIYCAKACGHFELNRRDARAFMWQKGPLEEPLQEKFESIAHRCEDMLAVYGTWKTFPLEPLVGLPGYRVVGSTLNLPSESLVKRLDGATHAVLMAFTLGMGYEREADRLASTNVLDALMFDACASSLVDDGAEGFQRQIENELASVGYEPTGLRYSPGYGDLSLEVQPGFLDALDAGRNIGVYVNDENLLIPAKSITALLGAKPIELTKAED